jgi:hypothetical protein
VRPNKRQRSDRWDTDKALLLDRFHKGEWELATKPECKHPLRTVNLQALHNQRCGMRFFLRFIPLIVWQLLVEAINEQLAKHQSSEKYVIEYFCQLFHHSFSHHTRHNSRYRQTTIHELWGLYAHWMEVESTHGNHTRRLRNHLKLVWTYIEQQRGLGMDRIQILIAALVPSRTVILRICRLLSDEWQSLIQPVKV